MPKRVTVGTDLMEEEWLSYGPGEAKALGEHLGSFNWEPPLYATARRMLAVAGRWPDGIRIKHKEGTPAALASEWLINFRHLMRDMERVAGGDTGAKAVSALFYTGQRLGRLEERFFWRFGVDHETGARREALALSEKEAIANRRRGGATNATDAQKLKAFAHRRAAEISRTRTKPMSGRGLAAAVHKTWLEKGGPLLKERKDKPPNPPSFGTVRNYLSDFVAKV